MIEVPCLAFKWHEREHKLASSGLRSSIWSKLCSLSNQSVEGGALDLAGRLVFLDRALFTSARVMVSVAAHLISIDGAMVPD